ncbi:MAG TPA: hypothetical protein VK447_08005, partial [Myxococcaceae bacterium]|nr:hypothetical protein [Myxococcaceae bacterium]
VPGDDLRVTMVGERAVSCVSIETPVQSLDYRASNTYTAGQAQYREVTVPEHVLEQCRRAMRDLNLSFAGIDIKRHGDRYTFLELNNSPVYHEVEVRTGHPISRALAEHLIARARAATPGG